MRNGPQLLTYDPIGNFQEWKDLRGDLDRQPADDRICDCNFVNIAPLQLGKEVIDLHCLTAPHFARGGAL